MQDRSGRFRGHRFRRPLRRAWLGTAALALLCGAPALADDAGTALVRWTDADGITRYSPDASRVPRAARDTIEPIAAREGPAALAPPPPPVAAAAAVSPSGDLDARIEALERAIARDEQALRAQISNGDEGVAALSDDEMAEIADRLPALQTRLRALKREREGNAPLPTVSPPETPAPSAP